MAAIGQSITVGTSATLVFQVVDATTYAANGYTPSANPNIFKAGDVNAPIPLWVILPTGTTPPTFYFGGSTVTTTTGAAVSGSQISSFAYNVVGDDSLYACVASGTATLQLLALRQ